MAVISQNRQRQGAPGWLPNRANKFTSRLVAYAALQIIGYFATDILVKNIDALRCGRHLLLFSPLFLQCTFFRIGD